MYYRISYACAKRLKFTYTQESVYVLLHLLQFHRYVYGKITGLSLVNGVYTCCLFRV